MVQSPIHKRLMFDLLGPSRFSLSRLFGSFVGPWAAFMIYKNDTTERVDFVTLRGRNREMVLLQHRGNSCGEQVYGL